MKLIRSVIRLEEITAFELGRGTHRAIADARVAFVADVFSSHLAESFVLFIGE